MAIGECLLCRAATSAQGVVLFTAFRSSAAAQCCPSPFFVVIAPSAHQMPCRPPGCRKQHCGEAGLASTDHGPPPANAAETKQLDRTETGSCTKYNCFSFSITTAN
ncbi:hypothetical protein MAPG_03913 [Magnaporthiopsis poae ATCC 64411]|uniref:Uncharacterized protein n=1 Tax=Magnaporthiopsis poae (strain ATCC 64411 / 73-15) TaxID=644358 RepID=A0A0C4DVB1_MAGP6|nr:hypothetical protein MAPG_03913 [Magnaporthiopsis poae ATCC 64411]